MDIDSLINVFNYNTSVQWKPKQKFVEDLNFIIEELNYYESFININIYDILVSCGHNLTWDQEYYISKDDLNWLIGNEGKEYFLTNLNKQNKINTINEYQAVLLLYTEIVSLFELQIE